MKVICTMASGYDNFTVGKEYETLYVEKKNFMSFPKPYIELVDDKGFPFGYALCDAKTLTFDNLPDASDAHGVEAKIPLSRKHEISQDFIDNYSTENDFWDDSK